MGDFTKEVEEKLKDMGFTLPKPGKPVGSYVDVRRGGNLLFVSGKLPLKEDGSLLATGKLGGEVDQESGYAAAQLCMLHILAAVEAECNGFPDELRALKIGGFVASTPDFTSAAAVINGASELLVTLLGNAGKHARAAVNVAALPLDSPVEVDAVFQI